VRTILFLVFVGALVWLLSTSFVAPKDANRPILVEDDVRLVTVDGIFAARGSVSPVVILTEQGGTHRSLPIWIGYAEADAIRRRIYGEVLERPLTHELLVKTVEELGASITRVVVTELRDSTFYARVDLEDSKHTALSIDARPSDAIALALGASAPIFVNLKVLDEAARLDLIIKEPPSPEEAVTPVGCGIWCQELDPELARALGVEQGVLVADLSPAQVTAGVLERGDVIAEIGGQSATSVEHVRRALANRPAETTIQTRIIRNGRTIEVELTCQ
jgi:bifunctional DNase/RNase